MLGAGRLRSLVKQTQPGDRQDGRVKEDDVYAYVASVWPELLPAGVPYGSLSHPSLERGYMSNNPVTREKRQTENHLQTVAEQRTEVRKEK